MKIQTSKLQEYLALYVIFLLVVLYQYFVLPYGYDIASYEKSFMTLDLTAGRWLYFYRFIGGIAQKVDFSFFIGIVVILYAVAVVGVLVSKYEGYGKYLLAGVVILLMPRLVPFAVFQIRQSTAVIYFFFAVLMFRRGWWLPCAIAFAVALGSHISAALVMVIWLCVEVWPDYGKYYIRGWVGALLSVSVVLGIVLLIILLWDVLFLKGVDFIERYDFEYGGGKLFVGFVLLLFGLAYKHVRPSERRLYVVLLLVGYLSGLAGYGSGHRVIYYILPFMAINVSDMLLRLTGKGGAAVEVFLVLVLLGVSSLYELSLSGRIGF